MNMLKAKVNVPDHWIDSLPVAVYTCDLDGLITDFNKQAADLWGREPRIGDHDERYCGSLRLFYRDGTPLPHVKTPMAECILNGTPVRGQQVVIERPDGSRIIVLVNIAPVIDDNGARVGAINCFQDITELEQAREAVQQQTQQLHDILDALPAAVYTTDAEGRLTFYNKASIAFSGHRPRLGDDRWCVSWKLRTPEGEDLPFAECPMGQALREDVAIRGAEAVAIRPDGGAVPFLAYPTPLHDAAGQVRGAVNMLVDIRERKAAEKAQALLIDELNHRVKNTLAIVKSIARQSLRTAPEPQAFATSFGGRIDALARAHDLLTEQAWRGVGIAELIAGQLGLHSEEPGRITLDGPAYAIGPQESLTLALVLHELGANAQKYGALSRPGGQIDVRWTLLRTQGDDEPRLRLDWRERGGPPVTRPQKRGFGTRLIEESLCARDGSCQMHFHPEGLECVLELRTTLAPVSQASDAGDRPAAPRSDDVAVTQAEPHRVLIIEDEPLLRLDLEAMVVDAGWRVSGSAGDLDTALQRIADTPTDIVLLDANLQGQPVDDICAALVARNIPFAFVSGYPREALPRAYRQAPLLRKPVDDAALARELAALSECGGSAGTVG